MYAILRRIARSPLFTIVAALSLALGIAGTAVIFTLIDALLLRPLPVSEPERLVRILVTVPGGGNRPLSYPELLDVREAVPALEGPVGYQFNDVILTVGSEPAMALAEVVSGDYFDVLGVAVSPGRGFRADEDAVPNRDAVAVISHSLWQTRFDGDPAVVGRSMRINGHPFTVIGVAEDGFRGAFGGLRVDLWAPAMMQAQVLPASGDLTVREDRFLMLIGRLGPDVTRERVRAQLEVAAERLAAADPAVAGTGFVLEDADGVHPLVASLAGVFLAVLMGMMAIVLLIACANVANLMLARASVRERDIAVRSALGASRWRIGREFLAEGLVIAGIGGAAGLVIAVWATRLLSAWRPDIGIPVALDLRVDARVVVFAALVTLAVALIFSVGPAVRAARSSRFTGLRDRSSAGPERMRVRRLLVVAQVSMSALLLFGAGLLARSLSNAVTIDPGFEQTGITVVRATPDLLGYDEARGRAFWLEIEARAAALPGIREASLALMIPLGDRSDRIPVSPADRPPPAEPETALTHYDIVGPGWFDMLAIRLRQGRDFNASDATGTEPVAVISEALAALHWPDGGALGGRLRLSGRDGVTRIATVIGVVEDVNYRRLGEAPRPVVYVPFSQWYRPDMTLFVRADDPSAVRTLVARLRDVEPDLPVMVAAMEDKTSYSLIPLRMAGSVIGIAGTIGLFLATTGIFGIIAYTVSRESRDIAIRVALGAERRRVGTMIAVRSVRLTFAGVAIGLILALFASRLLSGMLYGVATADPLSLAVVTFVFAGVSAIAAWAPARRAATLDPARLLHED